MEEIAPWEAFIRSTWLHLSIQAHEPWLWPILQTLHYLGACLLIGTVGLFDLRILAFFVSVFQGTVFRNLP